MLWETRQEAIEKYLADRRYEDATRFRLGGAYAPIPGNTIASQMGGAALANAQQGNERRNRHSQASFDRETTKGKAEKTGFELIPKKPKPKAKPEVLDWSDGPSWVRSGPQEAKKSLVDSPGYQWIRSISKPSAFSFDQGNTFETA